MLRGKYDYDVFVLGGGSAGMRAALVLAGEGKRVGLSDPGKLGGYESAEGYGLRAPLIQAARLMADIKQSPEIGIRGGSVGYNYPTLREWSHGARVVSAVSSTLEKAGVTLYRSAARFVGPHEVSLGRQRITSAQFVIATGSAPVIPKSIIGLSDVAYLTPESAVELLKPPKSLFIIGGGKTGVEFAGLFGTFGSHVSVAEISPRLLPDEDASAGDAVRHAVESRGGDVLTSARITSVSKEGTLHRITYLRGDVEHVAKAEAILLSAGRAPALDLGLENAEVDYSPLGIAVNDYLQTTTRHVYAAGSITGNIRGAEGARLEGEYAARNILRRDKTASATGAVPVVFYSQPMVARVGVNEGEALRKDIITITATARFDHTVSGRASRDHGSVTLIANRKGLLIGATVIGASASDLINTFTVAIDAGMSIEKLASLPFAFGSAGEAVAVAAQAVTAQI